MIHGRGREKTATMATTNKCLAKSNKSAAGKATKKLSMTLIATRPPRLSIVERGMTAPNCVRAFRQDPEGVCLQIRLQTRSVSAYLTLAQALDLAKGILDAAANHEEREQ